MTKRPLYQLAGAVAFVVMAGFETAQAQIHTTLAQLSGVIEADMVDRVAEPSPTGRANPADPWEGFNRTLFEVHTFVDDNFMVPAALGYRAVTPKPGRRGIRRFLANARTPGIFINDILQGEIGRAGQTLSRFLINSTIGAGGFADPAERMGITPHSEDFGQTLAVWGMPSGPYTFTPLFGPGTVRSNIGLLGQIAFNPLVFIRTDAARNAGFARAGASALSAREPLIEPLEDIRANSLDYYASFRSFYLQAREREIANGRTPFDDLPDISEFEDFEDEEAFETGAEDSLPDEPVE